MDLPLTTQLVQFLKQAGYKYWLAKIDEIEGEAYFITLSPAFRQNDQQQPDNYSYFDLSEDFSLVNKTKIIVNLTEETTVEYKKFLVKAAHSRLPKSG